MEINGVTKRFLLKKKYLFKIKNTMEKLTEKINTFKVSQSVKDDIVKIAEFEEINIQQVCRKLIRLGISKYFSKYGIEEENESFARLITH